jgi:transposase
MRTGRPKTPLVLTEAESESLESLATRARTRPHLARRARIILLCGEGLASTVAARRLHTRAPTIGKWRGRFVRDRLDGLSDEPRPGAPRTIADADVERAVIRNLETTPRGATQWSLGGMANATGLSRMTISRIWHAFGLQPHRDRTVQGGGDLPAGALEGPGGRRVRDPRVGRVVQRAPPARPAGVRAPGRVRAGLS